MNIPRYRVWDKRNKKIRNKVLLINFSDEYILIVEDEALSFEEIELMQYTGVKDKRGNEICEGDIIHWKDSGDSEEVLEDIVEVYWNDEFLKWCVKNEKDKTAIESLYDYSIPEELEIIGNIYERR